VCHSGWPITLVTQAMLQCADELIQNIELNGLQPQNLQLGSQYSREVWTTLMMPYYIQKCVLVGFHEV